jgi:uncharacterized protein Yka (UPF0111/DUF47 family)
VKLNLVPRETRFFELFNQEAGLVRETLGELGRSLADGTSSHERLNDLEHACDEVTHEIYNLINLTFTPPMEPEDILRLAHSLDGVVDLAEEIGDKIDLYKATPIPAPAKDLGDCLMQAGVQLEKAVNALQEPRGLPPILHEIHTLENVGDRVSREALQQLLNGTQSATADVIKWKDLYDLLEATMDECEAAAEIIETIAIKNA